MNKQEDIARRRADLSPAKQALLERRLHGKDGQLNTHREIPRIQHSGPIPLSHAQQRLWFLEQLQPGFTAYNLSFLVKMKGQLDLKVFERSLATIIERHEALRTTFTAENGHAVQVISPFQPFSLDVVDVDGASDVDCEKQVKEVATGYAKTPFTLTKGPLYRFTLLHLDNDRHMLAAIFHHIVFDGWSMGVFLDELTRLYNAFSEGKPSPLPNLPIQYADYTQWHRDLLAAETSKKDLAYWKEHLAAPSPALDLPIDHPRPHAHSFCGTLAQSTLTNTVFIAAREMCQRESATLYTVLLAAWSVFLHRYTDQDDIIIGSGLAGRNRAELEGLIGFFVNTLPLRVDISENPTFQELVKHVTKVLLNAHEHQEVPFEQLVATLHPDRELSRTPLFQVMFTLDNTPKPTRAMTGLDICIEELDNDTAKFDLTLAVEASPEGLTLNLEYNTDLFDRSTGIRMLKHYQHLLADAVTNPGRRVSELSLFSDAEKHQLLVTWNDTAMDYPRNACIHELFEMQVKETPNAVAVVFQDEILTYCELNRRANQLAHHLQRLGVGPETRVGVCMERSAELVVAVCGILKAGGAYVPLEPTLPKERLIFLINNAGISLVVIQETLLHALPQTELQVVCLKRDSEQIAEQPVDNLSPSAIWSNLAYVMYTSGSTGIPKGVGVTHRNVVRLVKSTNYVRLDSNEVFLFLSNFAFDASTFELWGCLLNGGRLVVYPPEIPSLKELGDAIERYGVTTLWLTAGLLHQMIETQLEKLHGVRQLLAGGDVLSAPHVRTVLATLPNCTLINGYGPTECTTFSCCYPMTHPEQVGVTVPIGHPIANTRVYILDKHMNPVPVGVQGELYIGGDGVARGYLNQPELTAKSFVPDPFSDEADARLYRTGDIVRWIPDGVIEFIGRRDGQVKLRGYRIEVGEIEAALYSHPDVQDAIVMARGNHSGDKRLVAYITLNRDAKPDPGELRTFLRNKLPEYMVPGTFVFLETLPLTKSGKVDRKALPDPMENGNDGFMAPRSFLEETLVRIWSQLLGTSRISIRESFFDIGGHSLLALQMVALIRKILGAEIPLREVFLAPTIETLAGRIASLTTTVENEAPSMDTNHVSTPGAPEKVYDPCIVAIRKEGSRLPLFCIEGTGSAVSAYGALTAYLHPEQPVFGLQDLHLGDDELSVETVQQQAARYVKAIRTVQTKGPYYLAGWSFGGTLAYEMAQQLLREGESIRFLAMMESYVCMQPDSLLGRWWHHVSQFPARVRVRLVMMYYTFPIIRGYVRDGFRMAISRITQRSPEPSGTMSLKSYLTYIWHDINRQYFTIQAGIEPVDPAQDRITMAQDPFLRRLTLRISANIRAMRSYSMQPYPGRITFFRAEHDPWHAAHHDTTRGWNKVAQGGVDVCIVPGNHLVLLKKPFVETFGKELRHHLDTAQSQTDSGEDAVANLIKCQG